MDKKIIKQYGEDILCYRLRTARQKKRMQYKDFDKWLLKLNRIEKGLLMARRNLGFEPLVPPVQKGWKRHFVLRDDIAKGKYADFFESILKKINTYHYSNRKDFKVKKRKRGKKCYVKREQKLLSPHSDHFFKMKLTDREMQFFHEVPGSDSNGRPVKCYEFNEPWRYVLKVLPNMIYKRRVINTRLESEIKKIDMYMERNDYRKRQGKILRGYYKWRFWKQEEKHGHKDVLKWKSLMQVLDSLKD